MRAMLILALAVAVSLVWWFLAKREEPVGPVVRYMASAGAIVCLGIVAAVRAGPLVGLLVVAACSVVLWLSTGGAGGDGPGGDEPDPPSDPEPDPGLGKRPDVPTELLDRESFDRARAEWERELHS